MSSSLKNRVVKLEEIRRPPVQPPDLPFEIRYENGTPYLSSSEDVLDLARKRGTPILEIFLTTEKEAQQNDNLD